MGVPLTPTLFKGQLYLDPQLRQKSMLKFLFRENRATSPGTNPNPLLGLMPRISTVKEKHVSPVVKAWEAPAGARPLFYTWESIRLL